MVCLRALTRARARQRMRARRFGQAKRGVAAVIGTLLALLVFMTLFGIFLTQFVPLWMEDNEAAEANTVAGQIGQAKSCMDQLALIESSRAPCTTPITMQSAGIPIFGTPTQATLNFQQIPNLFTTVSFNISGVGPSQPNGNFHLNSTPAELQVILPDRYYVPVTYTLSMGAVVQSQGGVQQNLLFQPAITGSNVSTQTTLDMTLYAMYGPSTSVSSVGTSEVYVSYLESQNYSATNTAVNITMTTPTPCAWDQFFGSAFLGTPIVPQYNPAGCSFWKPTGAFYLMHAYFPPVTFFNLNIVYFDVQVGPGNPT